MKSGDASVVSPDQRRVRRLVRGSVAIQIHLLYLTPSLRLARFKITMNLYYSPLQLSDSAFWGALATFNRRRELIRLIRWASAKGYQKPLRLYRFRLQEEEMRIYRYSLHHHRAATFAYIIHLINTILFRHPRYFRPGAASYHNRSFLTGITNSL